MGTAHLPWILYILVPIFGIFGTIPLASAATEGFLRPRAAPEPLNCSSKFSGDYYGLGVRLGIYLTWITSWLANTFLEEEISTALDANSIFLFALLVSIFNATRAQGAEKLAYIDGLVLMQLCAGYLFGTLSLWGYRTSHYSKEGPRAIRHYGRIGTHCRLGLATAISIYGIWFWAYGIRYDIGHGLRIVTDDKGDPRPPECYPVYVFFFGKLNVLGGIRIFYIIITISTTLYYGTMLLAAVAERIRHLIQLLRREKGHEKRETLRYRTGLTKKELEILFAINRIFNIVWIGFSVLMVELTLIWNHVTQVIGPNGNITYPAQLLPLMIGTLGFLRICWLLFKKTYFPHLDRPEVEHATQHTMHVARESPSFPDDKVGPMSTPSAPLEGTDVVASPECSASTVRNRRLVKRYLVAYLPWLANFGFWRGAGADGRPQSSFEEEGKKCHDSPVTVSGTSFGQVEDADTHIRKTAS